MTQKTATTLALEKEGNTHLVRNANEQLIGSLLSCREEGTDGIR
jgi:hypothetical protein